MAVSDEDMVRGNNARLTIRGWEFDRIFTVSELTGIGSGKSIEAVQATNVAFRDPHPALNNAFALEFIPESIESSDAMRVTIRYRQFSEDYLVEVGSRTLNNETAGWLNDPDASDGDPRDSMLLDYTYPDDYKLKPELAGETVEQSVRLSVQRRYPEFVITRTEFETKPADVLSGHSLGIALTGNILTDRSVIYNDTTNKANWNVRPNDAAHLWKCVISGASAEDGLAFRVRYAFTYDPDFWKFEATYIDPYSGQPVPDPVPVVGQFEFNQYLAQDFTLLGLR